MSAGPLSLAELSALLDRLPPSPRYDTIIKAGGSFYAVNRRALEHRIEGFLFHVPEPEPFRVRSSWAWNVAVARTPFAILAPFVEGVSVAHSRLLRLLAPASFWRLRTRLRRFVGLQEVSP